jgi:hypothetical protein
MDEGEVVSRLADFTNTLLAGVSVFFTVISAYVAGLNYFVRRANWAGRASAFFFLTFVLAVLLAVMVGARRTQWGLIARLEELKAQGDLTAAGRALLENANAPVFAGGEGLWLWREAVSVDGLVVSGLWGGLGLTYLGLFFLTFVFRWGVEGDQP